MFEARRSTSAVEGAEGELVWSYPHVVAQAAIGCAAVSGGDRDAAGIAAGARAEGDCDTAAAAF